MNGKHYRFILLAALVAAVILTGVSWALVRAEAEPTAFTNVRLWIYPEYDDPRLLVMLEGNVEGVGIPATVRFLVPAAAEMYSAGSMDDSGIYSGGPPRRESSSIQGWDEISYEVTSNTFRVEYYDPIITGQPDKTITCQFLFLYPISDLTVMVQEPRASSNFNVLPGGGSTLVEEGFTYHRYSYSDLTTDESLGFNIAYTKSNPNPSLSIDDGGSTDVSPIVGAIVGLSVLIPAAVFFALKFRARHRTVSKRTGSKVRTREAKRKQPRGRFCTGCGRPLEGSPRFCPHCGVKVG